MANMQIWKIKSNISGLFSTGGSFPSWSKNGKIWKQRGHLTSHFTNLDSRGRRTYLQNDAVVVLYEISETPLLATPTEQWIVEAKQRAEEKEAQHQETIRKWREKEERAEFEKLKKKYG